VGFIEFGETVEMRGKIKSPTRKADLWGTQIRTRVLRPGYPLGLQKGVILPPRRTNPKTWGTLRVVLIFGDRRG
jgi:hypothetical protein